MMVQSDIQYSDIYLRYKTGLYKDVLCSRSLRRLSVVLLSDHLFPVYIKVVEVQYVLHISYSTTSPKYLRGSLTPSNLLSFPSTGPTIARPGGVDLRFPGCFGRSL